jgi:hypothetical protein
MIRQAAFARKTLIVKVHPPTTFFHLIDALVGQEGLDERTTEIDRLLPVA